MTSRLKIMSVIGITAAFVIFFASLVMQKDKNSVYQSGSAVASAIHTPPVPASNVQTLINFVTDSNNKSKFSEWSKDDSKSWTATCYVEGLKYTISTDGEKLSFQVSDQRTVHMFSDHGGQGTVDFGARAPSDNITKLSAVFDAERKEGEAEREYWQKEYLVRAKTIFNHFKLNWTDVAG